MGEKRPRDISPQEKWARSMIQDAPSLMAFRDKLSNDGLTEENIVKDQKYIDLAQQLMVLLTFMEDQNASGRSYNAVSRALCKLYRAIFFGDLQSRLELDNKSQAMFSQDKEYIKTQIKNGPSRPDGPWQGLLYGGFGSTSPNLS